MKGIITNNPNEIKGLLKIFNLPVYYIKGPVIHKYENDASGIKHLYQIAKPKYEDNNRSDYTNLDEYLIDELKVPTGYECYLKFYNTLGKLNIEKLKELNRGKKLINNAGFIFINENYKRKLIEDTYVFDVNSAFTNGILKLDSKYNFFKDYFLKIYDKRKKSNNFEERYIYKSLMNRLIGYFENINELKYLRRRIIKNSNDYVKKICKDVILNGGVVYLSNTDSIFTDKKGYEAIKDNIGYEIGDLKVKKYERFYYESNVIYQLDDILKHSGKSYFCRMNSDLLSDITCEQEGKLIIHESNFYYNQCFKDGEFGSIITKSYKDNKIIKENKYHV